VSTGRTPFYRWLTQHWLWAFLLMGLALVLFGAASLNLAHLFTANFGFLMEHGWDAVQEGALRQLAELVASMYGAVAFWLLFKTCEQALVQRLTQTENQGKDS